MSGVRRRPGSGAALRQEALGLGALMLAQGHHTRQRRGITCLSVGGPLCEFAQVARRRRFTVATPLPFPLRLLRSRHDSGISRKSRVVVSSPTSPRASGDTTAPSMSGTAGPLFRMLPRFRCLTRISPLVSFVRVPARAQDAPCDEGTHLVAGVANVSDAPDRALFLNGLNTCCAVTGMQC